MVGNKLWSLWKGMPGNYTRQKAPHKKLVSDRWLQTGNGIKPPPKQKQKTLKCYPGKNTMPEKACGNIGQVATFPQ